VARSEAETGSGPDRVGPEAISACETGRYGPWGRVAVR